MHSIKQVCLGVAVAGMVAGGGATAVAHAEPSATDSTTSTGATGSESKGRAAGGTSRSRNRAAQPAPTAGAPAERGVPGSAGSATTTNGKTDDGRSRGSSRNHSAADLTVPVAGTETAQGAPTSAETSVPTAVLTDSTPGSPAAQPAADTTVSEISVPEISVAEPVSATPPPAEVSVTPADPAPQPLPVPLLPVLPALPALPASAVSVSAASGTGSRVRAASAVAQAQVLADPPPAHVLLIGTDGTNLSKILADPANVGFFDLMDQSVTGAASIVGHTTISGPSWSTILTGAWDNKTGVINNLFNPAPYDSWPTVFNLLEAYDSSIDTAVVADWRYMNDIAGAGAFPVAEADNHFYAFDTSWADTDQLVVDKTIELISGTAAETSTFIFSYQVQVDEAGHAYGGGSAEYKQAVTNVSDNIAEIMAAVGAWETATGEDWTVIVTTDHGHQQSVGFGHGFQSPNEISSFVIFELAGDSANDGNQNLAYSTADVTPTIVSLFGAPLRSDFDGVPMQSDAAVLNSIVDPVDLQQALSEAISMFGYPDIGTDLALGTRTVFASIPYFLDGFVTTITDQLQAIVDADIFLVSTLAGVTQFAVQAIGDALVAVTQAVARVVAYATGAGTIAPTDPPLTAPTQSAQVLLTAAQTALVTQSENLLTNPGAEFGDPALSGNSAVTIPGWTVTGTPTVIQYGTPRNFWPVGLSFPMPDLPSFMSFPKANSGPPDGGVQFFGGGNVADATLTQLVDLGAASTDIDTGAATYNLSGWLGGWLFNLSSASVKVDFLDSNKTYLGTASIGPVGVLERFFNTGLKQRQTAGAIPIGTRYAQVDVILDQRNVLPLGFNIDYNSAFADNISFTISSDLPAPPDPTPPVSTVGELDHVFMVYMENKGYDDIVGSPNAPYLNSLINAYGLAQNYYGLTHPSLPNYYWVVNGIDTGITYECEQVCIFDHGTLLTDNIDAAGMTWRGYAQSQPPGKPLENSGDYSVSELPFVAFDGIGNNEAYAVQHLFPLEQMAIDLSSSETAPNFAWYAANESFNGEGPIDSIFDVLKFFGSQLSPTHQYNVAALDQFLSETVSVVLNSEVWQDPAERSVLVVTFDEDNDNLSLGFGDEGNHIVTVVIPSPAAIAAGMRSGPFVATDHYNHYSLLRMIEDSLGLPNLTNNDKFAPPMNEFWTDGLTAGAGIQA